jgi:hypothetical protein
VDRAANGGGAIIVLDELKYTGGVIHSKIIKSNLIVHLSNPKLKVGFVMNPAQPHWPHQLLHSLPSSN